MIKVLICSSGEIWGGVEKFIFSFVKELQKRRKYKVYIVLYYEGELAKRLREIGADVEVYQKSFFFQLLFTIKKIKDDGIQIIHSHGFMGNIIGGLSTFFSRRKWIKTVHGAVEPRKHIDYKYIRMKIYTLIDNIIQYFLCDLCVYVSRDLLKRASWLCRRTPHTVIYNGIEQNLTNYSKSLIVRNNLDKNKIIKLGIIGRIVEVKGHIYLIKAIQNSKYKNYIKLYIYGNGPLKINLKNYCQKNKLNGIIEFKGFVREIIPELKKLDIIVIPSLYEGIPFVILEAMASNIPIIASRIGGLKEILEDNRDALLTNVKDANSIRKAIEKLYLDENLRVKLARNAYKKFVGNFTLKKMCIKYLNIYNQMLGVANE